MEQITEQEQKLLDYYYKKQKQKKIIILGVIVGIVVILVGVLGYSISSQSKWDVREDTITIEYGTSYQPTVAAIVDTNKYPFITSENTKITSNISNEEGKEYPAVGNYQLVVSFSGNINILGLSIPSSSERTVALIIKDTTAPKVTPPEKIEILVGSEFNMDDYIYLFKIEDYSPTQDMVYDTSNVNTGVVGTYTIDAMVEDVYGNQTEFQIPISVINDPYEDVVPSEEVTASSNSSEQTTTTQTSNQQKQAQSTNDTKRETTTKKEIKYSNKDFLFSDGYTMSTVSEAAYNYLKSTGKSGECIPLQDDEGIYIGMRVVIYD